MSRAVTQRMSNCEELNEDYLLALQLSEGVDQFGLISSIRQGCDDQNPDPDFLLALRLSEGSDQSAGGSGQLESDAEFARRLARELDGSSYSEELQKESMSINADMSANVALLREWYAGTQGQASNIGDLFQHLSYLDDVMLRERSGLRLATETKSAPSRTIHRRSSIFRQPNNIFRQPKSKITPPKPLGTGFSNGFVATSSKPGEVTSPKTQDSEVDKKTSAAFDFMSTNFYDFNGEVSVGRGRGIPVQPIVTAMFDLSLFAETTETILRIDSIKDLADRVELVKSLLRLLKTISLRDEYRNILTRPRRLKKRTKGLREIAQSPIGSAITSTIVLEDEKEPKSQPLFDLLSRLKFQAEVYLKGARSSDDGTFQFGEGAVSARLCEHIVEVHDSMLNTNGFISPPGYNSVRGNLGMLGPTRSSTTLAALPKPKTLDWSSAILDAHYLRQDALQIVNLLPGRQAKLVRQISELTNLPDGIYVRVMEARPDVLKALIVGPKGTPYEGGLFEFDILAPGDFPNSPPRVILKTTGGGRVRFNPNLYADGKVCLSLINTWQGAPIEQWQPGSSTLLQVLVSIQSMIFVECPYINEPGREALAGQAASNQHKEFVRANTIRWAMLDWLQDYFKKNGIWKDVVRAHFVHNASQLRQLVRSSAVNNVGIWHYHGNQSEDTLVRNPIGGMNLEKELDTSLSSIALGR